MGRVVGEVRGDPGEEVLVGFARHQVAVGQRRLAEFGQLAVARAIDVDPDAALVLELVADLAATEQIGFGRSVRRTGSLGGLARNARDLASGLGRRPVIHSRCRLFGPSLLPQYRRTVHDCRLSVHSCGLDRLCTTYSVPNGNEHEI